MNKRLLIAQTLLVLSSIWITTNQKRNFVGVFCSHFCEHWTWAKRYWKRFVAMWCLGIGSCLLKRRRKWQHKFEEFPPIFNTAIVKSIFLLAHWKNFIMVHTQKNSWYFIIIMLRMQWNFNEGHNSCIGVVNGEKGGHRFRDCESSLTSPVLHYRNWIRVSVDYLLSQSAGFMHKQTQIRFKQKLLRQIPIHKLGSPFQNTTFPPLSNYFLQTRPVTAGILQYNY